MLTRCKNYGNWLAADKVIAKISRLTFLAHPVYTSDTLSISVVFTLSFFLSRLFPENDKG